VAGVVGGYYFNVVMQGGTPGAYLASFSALYDFGLAGRQCLTLAILVVILVLVLLLS